MEREITLLIRVIGEPVCNPGMLMGKSRLAGLPGIFANSSPYHSFPLARKLTVSSSWKIRSEKCVMFPAASMHRDGSTGLNYFPGKL